MEKKWSRPDCWIRVTGPMSPMRSRATGAHSRPVHGAGRPRSARSVSSSAETLIPRFPGSPVEPGEARAVVMPADLHPIARQRDGRLELPPTPVRDQASGLDFEAQEVRVVRLPVNGIAGQPRPAV